MSDAARPIAKPTRGRDVLGEAISRLSSPENVDRKADMDLVAMDRAYQDEMRRG